jgi:outer membrane protein assembly factor BamB
MTQCSPAKLYQGDHGGTFDGDVMYVSCGNSFHALNKDVGSDIWSLPALDYETSPVVRDGKIFAVRDQRVAAIGSDGVQLWAYPPTLHSPYDPRRASLNLPENYIYTPLAFGADGTIYAGARMVNKLVAIDSQTGGLKWAFDAKVYAPFRSSPVVAADGTIYAQTMVGVAYAIDPDGSLKWTYQLPQTHSGDLHAAPTIGSDGTVYFVADSLVVALSPEGKPRGDFGLSGPSAGSPVLSPDGILYVATLEGNVFAIRTMSGGLMEAPWPKFQRDNSNSGRAASIH